MSTTPTSKEIREQLVKLLFELPVGKRELELDEAFQQLTAGGLVVERTAIVQAVRSVSNGSLRLWGRNISMN